MPQPVPQPSETPRRLRKALPLLGAVALVAAGTLGVLAPAAAAASTGGVVNEVYGGGGNSGATLTNDFIELANRGSASLTVDGWSVQYISASPGASTLWQATALTGAITAGGYYLIGEAAGAGGTQDLPATQATGTINMSGSAGTVALVKTTTLLTCKTAATCAADPNVVDLVGYGNAVVAEGTDAPGLSNTTSDQRSSAADTDNNSADFASGDPTPGAANAGGGGGGTGGGTEPGPLAIHDIQGTSWVSPHDGDTVTGVPGIVTGVRSSGSSKGYWIQSTSPDSNDATSEALFVFTSSPSVAVGDSVLVAGSVKDYYPLNSGDTVSTTSSLSTTEITQSGVTVLSHGNALPAPVLLKPNTVPKLYAPYVGGNIENTPITPARSALDFWEAHEGMRVEVDNARVIGPTDQYGELYVTTKPNEQRTPRGGSVITSYTTAPAGRIEIAPAASAAPQVNVGDVLTGATIGPVDWSLFGGYTIAATTVGGTQDNHLAPVVAAPQSKNQLSVATYNVENLAPSDPASKFAALAAGVVTNLTAPDVIAVEEVQDNDGATDDGVVAADQTLLKLTAAIAAAGGPQYSWREIDPVNDKDGGQPGGNIRVVFLFNADRVSFVDSGHATSTSATGVVNYGGQPYLTQSPGRIAPTDPAWDSSRKPLAGQFLFHGRSVIVVANHFDSKLGDQNADGRYQPPARSSEVQRQQQAKLVHDFTQSVLKINKDATVVVAGDLNDYQFSPALQVLKTGTASPRGKEILTDLITTLPTNQQYTYVYDGISQTLDHLLVTAGAGKVKYQVVHINSEFTGQTSDHDPQLVRIPIS
ncbi:MAG: endonuclease/exonuclease/phosphatase family protein [Jatrophihabitans sp.]